MSRELHQASAQWASRPDDERFESLDLLEHSVLKCKTESWTSSGPISKAHVLLTTDGTLSVEVFNPADGNLYLLEPSHWGFGQLSYYAGAPASYLRTLPVPLAAMNLQWGLERTPVREDALILAQSNGHQVLRSVTGPSYGRIWDKDVVAAVKRVNEDGRWVIPAASYATKNPKRATTLYASDHDVFIFLVDPEHPVEVNGEQLFRGFMTWNSEVGASSFGLTTFLYRYVCDNRIIWGATNINELRIRHTGGAPDRFANEGAQYLHRYALEATTPIADAIKQADKYELSAHDKELGGWENWLKTRGFTGALAKAAIASAKSEEGEDRSLWNIINGITAHARSIAYADQRVKLETQAGDLLKIVSNN